MSNVYSILKKSKFAHIVLSLAMFFSMLSVVQASDVKSFTYFTGIGCPHCAKVSPAMHEKINNTDGLIMIEYELYKETSNARILSDYSTYYGFNLAIPLVVYGQNDFDLGDKQITDGFNSSVDNSKSNTIQLANGLTEWSTFDLNSLSGLPKIFAKDRVVIKNSNQNATDEQKSQIKSFLTVTNLDEYVVSLVGERVDTTSVEYPGGTENYNHGVTIGAWTLLWRGNKDAQFGDTDQGSVGNTTNSNISMAKVGTLALTDSINPCALSILLMMLVAISTYHPKDKKQVLWAGLAFVAAVFITYFIYGLLIVKAFDLVQGISGIKDYLYKGIGAIAIILGLLELKDFFFYKPGGIGTEMPLFLRPKVQKIIARVTSPLGAFGLGMFVTLFLLPCTIGPYVILGGMLSYGEFASALPYLSFYNLIFILPMVVIILLVFFGSKNIKQVTEWREKNVKIMHLIIGIIFMLLGVSMVFGWF